MRILLPALGIVLVWWVCTLANPEVVKLLREGFRWVWRDSDFYTRRAEQKLRHGDYDGAVDDFTRALRKNPDSPSIFYRRAETKVAMGEYQAAIADYTRAIRLKPQDTSIYYARSIARMKMGDSRGAIEDFDKAFEEYYPEWISDSWTGERLNARYLEAYVDRAVSKFDKADYDGTIADCKKAADVLQCMSWKPSYWRARALAKKGEIAEAICYYESAEGMQWFFYYPAYDRALEAAKKEDHAAYIKNYDQAKRLKKEIAPVYYHWARAYARLGKRHLAMGRLSEAVNADSALWWDASEDEAFRAFRDDPEFLNLNKWR